MHTVILGSGPVGLITNFIVGSDCVIGEHSEGNKTLRSIAPMFLWRTSYTERFLNELGISYSPRAIKFGWILPNKKVSIYPELKDRRSYYYRSRGIIRIGKDSDKDMPSSVASSGKIGVIETFNVALDSVVEELSKVTPVLRGKIMAIEWDGEKFFIEVDNFKSRIVTDRIINTLPLNVWNNLLKNVDRTLYHQVCISARKTWVVGAAYDPIILEYIRHKQYKYLYCADPSIPFDRVTVNNINKNSFNYEFNGDKNEEISNFVNKIDGSVFLSGDYQIVTGGGEKLQFNDSVLHVGRMARWDHSIRLHNVIEELYDV